MSNPLGGMGKDKLMAMCMFPSINYTPIKYVYPLPYPVWKMLGNSEGTTPTVKLNNGEGYGVDTATQPDCSGDFIGIGKGVKSRTVSDKVKPTLGSDSIMFEGQYMIRKGDPCTLNDGNTFGKYTDLGSVMSGLAHFSLGALSMIPPPVGTIFAAADTLLYVAEGDTMGAITSLASFVPCGIGKAAVGAAKIAGKALAPVASAIGKISGKFAIGGAWIKGMAAKVSPCILGMGINIALPFVLPSEIGQPVHAIRGAKILKGDYDLDYSGTGYLPFFLQRIYNSQNSNIGWFGKGWTAQGYEQKLRLEPQHDSIYLIDNSGREVPFSYLEPGKSCYQPYEDITLYRLPLAKNKEKTTLDGMPIVADAESGARIGQEEPLEFILYQGDYDPSKPNKSKLGYQGTAQYFTHVSDKVSRGESVVEATVLASKQVDQYGHELQLHYTHHMHSALADLPSHITDSNGDCYQLDFEQQAETDTGKYHARLHKLLKLVGSRENSESNELLAHYHYNSFGDLVKVVNHSQVLREFAYENHLLIQQTLPSGLKTYYRYNQNDHTTPPKTAKVIEHWIDNGEHYHFAYETDKKGYGRTTVTEQQGSELERKHVYEYDDWYNLIAYTDPKGKRTRFNIDHLFRITDAYLANGGHTKQEYHGKNLGSVAIKTGINPITGIAEYRTIRYQYDLNNQLIAITDASGNKESLVYNEHGEVISHSDAMGGETQYTYDTHGNLVKQTLANGSSYQLHYDEYSNLISQTDCSGYSSHYGYDDKQRLITISDAKGNQSQYHYDASKPWLEIIKKVIHADGTQTLLEYDDIGRLSKHTDAKGQSSEYHYSKDDLPIKRIDAEGHSLAYEYDGLRRLSKLINENGEEWAFSYDKLDNLIGETRFDGYTSHYRYNDSGQLIQQTNNPNHAREQQKHVYLQRDLTGQLTHKHNLDFITEQGKLKQRHHKSKYQYDKAGQLIKASSPDACTKLEYDKIGQLSSESLIRHHKGIGSKELVKQVLSHQYDEIGNRTKTTLPDGKEINNLYYGSGHLYNQSFSDENGKTTEIRHSETNELHQEVTRQQGELLSSFGYDRVGRLIAQKNTEVERDYTYDAIGQLTNISGRTQVAKSHLGTYQRDHQYQYDKVGRLTKHKLSDFAKNTGVTELFAFDPASNRLPVKSEIVIDKDNKETTIHTADIDKKSPTTKRTNELTTHNKHIKYYYDSHGRVEHKTQTPLGTDGKPLQQSGNSIIGYRETLKLLYNANDELAQSTKINQQGFEIVTTTTKYHYDAFGRRIAKSSESKKQNKLSPHTGQLLAVEKAVQQDKTEKQTTLMLWDGNRQAQEYTDNHVFTTVYEQNSFEPVARLVWLRPHVITEHVNDDDVAWLAEFNTEIKRRKIGDTVRERLGYQQEFSKKERLDSFIIPQVYYYHNDQLGTPNELTNEKGEVVWLNYSKAWGESYEVIYDADKLGIAVSDDVKISAEMLQPIRFQGQFFDEESGLHYNRFRYYDSDVGMFISRDPIGLMGGNNVFAYAPNPTGWVDPFGLACVTEKPKHGGWNSAPNWAKWKKTDGVNGTITPHENGSVTYTRNDGTAVTYSADGYPDFSPYAVHNVEVQGLKGNHGSDFKLANEAAGIGTTQAYPAIYKDTHVWHHHENGTSMLLVPKNIHNYTPIGRFSHAGGVSKSNN